MCVVDTHMCHIHKHMCHTRVVYKGFVLILLGARNPLPNALRVEEAGATSELTISNCPTNPFCSSAARFGPGVCVGAPALHFARMVAPFLVSYHCESNQSGCQPLRIATSSTLDKRSSRPCKPSPSRLIAASNLYAAYLLSWFDFLSILGMAFNA